MHVQLYQLSWLTADSHKPCCHPWFVCHGISQHNVLAHSGSPHDAEASSQYMWLRLQYVMVTRQYNIIIHFGFNFCLWNTHTLNNTLISLCVFCRCYPLLQYHDLRECHVTGEEDTHPQVGETVSIPNDNVCSTGKLLCYTRQITMYIVQVSCRVYASQIKQM